MNDEMRGADRREAEIIELLSRGRDDYLKAADAEQNYAAAGGLRIAADVLEGWINAIRMQVR